MTIEHTLSAEADDDFAVAQKSATPDTQGKPSATRHSQVSVADRHVGAKIRERRKSLGLSQQQLAAMIGVTYQQAHKYERGMNRISSGRLLEIADAMAVPIAWFFEGLGSETENVPSPRQRWCLELARNFAAIDNEKHQEALIQMARALAAQSLARRS